MEKMDAEEVLEPWERVSAAIGAAFYDESLDNDVSSLFRRADHDELKDVFFSADLTLAEVERALTDFDTLQREVLTRAGEMGKVSDL